MVVHSYYREGQKFMHISCKLIHRTFPIKPQEKQLFGFARYVQQLFDPHGTTQGVHHMICDGAPFL